MTWLDNLRETIYGSQADPDPNFKAYSGPASGQTPSHIYRKRGLVPLSGVDLVGTTEVQDYASQLSPESRFFHPPLPGEDGKMPVEVICPQTLTEAVDILLPNIPECTMDVKYRKNWYGSRRDVFWRYAPEEVFSKMGYQLAPWDDSHREQSLRDIRSLKNTERGTVGSRHRMEKPEQYELNVSILTLIPLLPAGDEHDGQRGFVNICEAVRDWYTGGSFWDDAGSIKGIEKMSSNLLSKTDWVRCRGEIYTVELPVQAKRANDTEASKPALPKLLRWTEPTMPDTLKKGEKLRYKWEPVPETETELREAVLRLWYGPLRFGLARTMFKEVSDTVSAGQTTTESNASTACNSASSEPLHP